MALALHRELAALSRPFNLGMLYDGRSDNLLPGITLWDEDSLKKVRKTQSQESSNYEVVTEDTMNKKSKLFDINADLKLSILGGLVPVSGAAQYLKNQITTGKQERITVAYKCTTRFEQLTMDQLGRDNMQHKEVFEHATATHVVTGILYGGQAFCVFDHLESERSEPTNISGGMTTSVASGCLMRILSRLAGLQAKGDLKIDEEDMEKAEQFHCKLHADFLLRKTPTTFREAVTILQDLPSLLGDAGEKAVPVKVWLYPLHLLDERAARIERMIGHGIVNQMEGFLQHLHDTSVCCMDMLQSKPCLQFTGIRKDIQHFTTAIDAYQMEVEKKLKTIVPKHRVGDIGDDELEQALPSNQAAVEFDAVLDAFNSKVKLLESYLKPLVSIRLTSEGDLKDILLQPDVCNIVCFVIDISYDVPYPAILAEKQEANSLAQAPTATLSDAAQSLRASLRRFKELCDANEDREGLQLLVIEGRNKDGPFGGHMRLYREGILINSDYVPASKPGIPKAEPRRHHSLDLTWSEPEFGAEEVVGYEVKYYCCDDPESCLVAESDYPYITIRELQPATRYRFRVRAICDAVFSAYSDESEVIATRPCSPPSNPSARRKSVTSDVIRWSAPETIASGQSIEAYLVYVVDTSTGQWLDPLMTNSKEVDMKVEPEKSYTYTVVAICGNDDTSLESQEVLTVGEDVMTQSDEAYFSKYVTDDAAACLAQPVTDDSSTQGHSWTYDGFPSLQGRDGVLQSVVGDSIAIGQIGTKQLYQLNLTKASYENNGQKCVYEFGEENVNAPEKTLLLFGAGGLGKSDYINSLLNYILGVNHNDSFRMYLTNPAVNVAGGAAGSPVCIYTLHRQVGFAIPYTLKIIDLPRYQETNEDHIDAAKQFFQYGEKIRYVLSGIDHIDVIGMVVPSGLSDLSPTQQHLCQYIFSLFGKDVVDNTVLLLTEADVYLPNAISVMKDAGIAFKKIYKFNNSAICSREVDQSVIQEGDSSPDDCAYLFWDLGMKLIGRFLSDLKYTTPQSMSRTAEVLEKHSFIADMYGGMESCLGELQKLKDKLSGSRNNSTQVEFENIQMKLLDLQCLVTESWKELESIALCTRPLPALEYEKLEDALISAVAECYT